MSNSVFVLSVHAILAIAMLVAGVIHIEEDRPVAGLFCLGAAVFNIFAFGFVFLDCFA